MSDNAVPPEGEVILLPERMPCLIKPPRRGRRILKLTALFLLLCACAGVLFYWWKGLPVLIEGTLNKGSEVWVKAGFDGEVGSVLAAPGQTIAKDEPLVSFRPAEAPPTSQAAMEELVKKLREKEESARKEVVRYATDASRAAFHRRRLEIGARDDEKDALEKAKESEKNAAVALKEARERFEKASHARAQLAGTIGEFAADTHSATPKERQRMKDMSGKKADESSRTDAERYLRAPQDGVVLESRATPGMKVAADQPLFSLMPLAHGEFSCSAVMPSAKARKFIVGTYCEAEIGGRLYPGRLVDIGPENAGNGGKEKEVALAMTFSSMEDDAPFDLAAGSPVKIVLYPRRQEEKK